MQLVTKLLTLSICLTLFGCAGGGIRTGKTEKDYLRVQPEITATGITDMQFEPESGSLLLDIQKYYLAREHEAPVVTTGFSTSTAWSDSVPLNNYKWVKELHSPALDIDVVVGDKTQRVNPAATRNTLVRYDLLQIFLNDIPGNSIKVFCRLCNTVQQIDSAGQVHTQINPKISIDSEAPPLPDLASAVQLNYKAEDLKQIKKQAYAAQQAIAAREREALRKAELDKQRAQQLERERQRNEEIARREAERAQAQRLAAQKVEQARIAKEGDGSADDLLCKKYGFKPSTQGYASCRMQIDMAKQELQRQRAIYEEQQRQYQAAQEAAQEAARKRRQSDFMIGMGLRMMGGQNASAAAIDQAVGAPMAVPSMPSPTRVYTLPNGTTMTCTTTGSHTNCF